MGFGAVFGALNTMYSAVSARTREIATLRALGFRQLRVRWHDTVARIEIDLGELEGLLRPGVREEIVRLGKVHGFAYVAVDLAGYRQGSHNEVLQGRSLRLV